MGSFIFKSQGNKAGKYKDDTSLDLVKKIAQKYLISEADAVALFMQETAGGTAKKPDANVNVLQLSPSDPERWKEVQEQIKVDPPNAMKYYIQGSLDRYRAGLTLFKGDSYKAMKYYHSRGEAKNIEYANSAQRLKREAIASGLAKDSKYIPPPDFEERAVHKLLGEGLPGVTYQDYKRVVEEATSYDSLRY